ncbi:uncharacterized protein LOC104418424 [Eucalyptus grandis]|uniref:uncharacterized protein LOC104418424 n=1 Tax=Eucalyptus grandis TaxID=71139 RepID=UPI00192EAD7F|nr:uncharacterized protein LOC104418424 [Eucalyptus grandis]
MSWLARSIANSLKLDDDDGDEESDRNPGATSPDPSPPPKTAVGPSGSPSSPSNESPRGVKEDLSELKKTLTRQLWGVASFLAPPPDPSSPPPARQAGGPDPSSPPPPGGPPPPQEPSDREDPDDEALIAGIRSDFAEISGRFRSGISKLSNNKTVWEFTKIASNLLQLGPEGDSVDEGLVGNAVGVTEEVLAFARNIAMHPETWLDFPLPDNEDAYSDEFELSDAQEEHALAIERLAPRLAALRMELCSEYMSDGCFWKIYFVLLHPRLNKQEAELLSTPQILEARAMLMHELQNRGNAKVESGWSGRDSRTDSVDSSHEEHLSVPSGAQSESAPSQLSVAGATEPAAVAITETEKHPVEVTEIQIIEKPVVEEKTMYQKEYQHSHSGSSSRVLDEKSEDDADDWLKEEETLEGADARGTTVHIENDEDVSFSDLEDDDGDMPTTYKKVTYGSDSSTKDSRDWVQLGGSSDDSSKEVNLGDKKGAKSEKVTDRDLEIKESNDWLNVDDIDEV